MQVQIWSIKKSAANAPTHKWVWLLEKLVDGQWQEHLGFTSEGIACEFRKQFGSDYRLAKKKVVR